MKILIAGAGGVRTDFVQQWLIRLLNPELQASWNVDCYTGRTIQSISSDRSPGSELNNKVYKQHFGIERLIHNVDTLVREFNHIIYINPDHTSVDECTKRAWEHITKAYMYNAAEDMSVEGIYNHLEKMCASVVCGMSDPDINGASVVAFRDMISNSGPDILAQVLDIQVTDSDRDIWKIALQRSHTPETCYYKGHQFAKQYVRERIEHHMQLERTKAQQKLTRV